MNYDLVIATTTYFGTYAHVRDDGYRRLLWKWFTKSLKESDFDGRKVLLLVADDASPEPPQVEFFPCDATIRYQKKHLGSDVNMVLNLNLAGTFAPLCLHVDSDAYFDPQWIKRLFYMVEKYPDAAGWNLYNSPHHRHITGEPEPGIIEKVNTQGHGLVYRTAERSPRQENEFVETFLQALTRNNSRKFILPKVSLIQHTGCYGVNNEPGRSQDYDPLFPYNAECGLAGYEDRSGFKDFVDTAVEIGVK